MSMPAFSWSASARRVASSSASVRAAPARFQRSVTVYHSDVSHAGFGRLPMMVVGMSGRCIADTAWIIALANERRNSRIPLLRRFIELGARRGEPFAVRFEARALIREHARD